MVFIGFDLSVNSNALLLRKTLVDALEMFFAIEAYKSFREGIHYFLFETKFLCNVTVAVLLVQFLVAQIPLFPETDPRKFAYRSLIDSLNRGHIGGRFSSPSWREEALELQRKENEWKESLEEMAKNPSNRFFHTPRDIRVYMLKPFLRN